MVLLLPLTAGVIAGMRTMLAPTTVAWAITPGPWAWGLTVLALGEFAVDLHPKTPHRTDFGPFVARLVSGGVSGGLIGAASGRLAPAIAAGAIGALVSTVGAHALRLRLARAFGRDWPAALIEDGVALTLAVVVWQGLAR
ncbi:MAG: hypothetical protein R2752_11910 [Vicinamibacterales bacterium]